MEQFVTDALHPSCKFLCLLLFFSRTLCPILLLFFIPDSPPSPSSH
ncbi:hypothetical protein SLEP1_g39498 [Rubroshorea leprosula]|uniref:Uncharacterized protein n=1 Tax=Rubroshorea leprosula TaxID=152421 RepID=A0AAV5L0D1_9ROSI|nr:hypothetical protein SLEP1_g39498 [Rubroshorea leprosula]